MKNEKRSETFLRAICVSPWRSTARQQPIAAFPITILLLDSFQNLVLCLKRFCQGLARVPSTASKSEVHFKNGVQKHFWETRYKFPTRPLVVNNLAVCWPKLRILAIIICVVDKEFQRLKFSDVFDALILVLLAAPRKHSSQTTSRMVILRILQEIPELSVTLIAQSFNDKQRVGFDTGAISDMPWTWWDLLKRPNSDEIMLNGFVRHIDRST